MTADATEQTAEDLLDTRAGLALANGAWQEGASTMLTSTNASGPWTKPVSPYSAPLLARIAADTSAPADTLPQREDTVAGRVTRRLTDAWGWPPGEPEAVTLGANFAQAAGLLTAGTRTTPDHLLDALIGGPTETAPTVKPGWDEIYAIVRDLVRDKGNVVYEWPDDEAAAYRDNHGFSEGRQAVEDLRAEKGTRAVLAVLPGTSTTEQSATIETQDMLDALPIGSVVLDCDGDAWQRRALRWMPAGVGAFVKVHHILAYGPLTVLHTP